MWHFYAGSPIEAVEITPDGELKTTTIGNNILKREVLIIVKKTDGLLHARKIMRDLVLLGCTVSPGFDFSILN